VVELTDEDLLKDWYEGDSKAFEAFYERHFGRTCAFLQKKYGVPRERAEEIAQAVFLKVHRSLGSYDIKRKALPWYFTVVRSTAVDWLRSEQRISRKERDFESQNQFLGAKLASFETSVDGQEEEAARHLEEMNWALEKLTPQERLLVEARFWKETPYQDLAAENAKSEPALRKQMERILRKMRTWMGTRRGA
jgi:RNA polymerase sigma factor (sigma-70 family)